MSSDQLTFLPPAYRASHIAWPGSGLARRMTVQSGLRCIRLLRSHGPLGRLSRTLLASSAWHSTACLLTWKPAVTKSGRLYFRLQVSTPRTGGTGFGLWPTPDVPNGGRGIPKGAVRKGNSIYTADGRKVQVGLANAVKLWPTPTPRTEGFDAGSHRGSPDSLHSAVKLFPTPKVCMDESSPSEGRRATPSLGYQIAANTGGKLNPDWVTALMGFPPGWLDLSPSDSDPIGRPAFPASRTGVLTA